MSDFYAIAYTDSATALRARQSLLKILEADLVTIHDIAVAENEDGKIRLHQLRTQPRPTPPKAP